MTPPEVWLRGPVDGIPALLQPVAHALLQVREESRTELIGFPAEGLWKRPAGVASVGFHLRHMAGVVDRLFTYARGEALSDTQRAALAGEGTPTAGTAEELLDALDACVERALAQLRKTTPDSLTQARHVGRQRLPSTTIGLLFHAAEHVQRHMGQRLVTVRVIRSAP